VEQHAGFEVGSKIIHMSRPHQRRFRVFLHEVHQGRVALPRGRIGLSASLLACRTDEDLVPTPP